ncbi:hypothetical protein [[Flexibacter] sp. ATCC 35208]|uniref:hypothetical protein n=1 Tax=[Flexibacter] sp. ATCC 35208 TaxID=1936242 RepID=UPI0009C8CE23|nr:hypothetical protein [[Flexibacter] sp. ATCC 35208]OMP75382.1 hypothetical protein BW716_30585 [[Flexibacter] sp. ATCC 35208]
MKIKKLDIKSFRHLNQLIFDFTYPEGHEKSGMPLEKICFIGQSATGKTGILELIKDNLISLRNAKLCNNYLDIYDGLNFDGEIDYLSPSDLIKTQGNRIYINGNVIPELPSSGGSCKWCTRCA